ncbi:MAG: hypothetical protein JO290_10775, partial [Sphingomonadaceae bacterium]|nr:hypothetical protein [Sphingomonadaceae bacterium]
MGATINYYPTTLGTATPDPLTLSIVGGVLTLGGTDFLEKTSGSNVALSSKSGTTFYLASPGEYGSLGQNNSYIRMTDSALTLGWNSPNMVFDSNGVRLACGSGNYAFTSDKRLTLSSANADLTGGAYTANVFQAGVTTTPGAVALARPTSTA